jgi:hypothetical protein
MRRATAGWEVARAGLEAPIELPLGAMEDCRRGDEPSAVFLGDRDRGGGRWVRLLRNIWWEVVMSGIEPVGKDMSARSLRESPLIVLLRTFLYIHWFGCG